MVFDIVKKYNNNFYENKVIKMCLYFKIGLENKIWFLYAGGF